MRNWLLLVFYVREGSRRLNRNGDQSSLSCMASQNLKSWSSLSTYGRSTPSFSAKTRRRRKAGKRNRKMVSEGFGEIGPTVKSNLAAGNARNSMYPLTEKWVRWLPQREINLTSWHHELHRMFYQPLSILWTTPQLLSINDETASTRASISRSAASSQVNFEATDWSKSTIWKWEHDETKAPSATRERPPTWSVWWTMRPPSLPLTKTPQSTRPWTSDLTNVASWVATSNASQSRRWSRTLRHRMIQPVQSSLTRTVSSWLKQMGHREGW